MFHQLFLPLLTLVPTQEPVTYTGRAFVFRADLAHGRAAGWIAEDRADEEVLAAITTALEARMRNAGRFPEAQVAREEEGRFSVTFVGPMGDAVEAFLIAGLANPGRLALHALPEPAELAELEIDLDAERARAAAWREGHAEEPWTAYSRVDREAGGPHPALAWLPEKGADGPVAVLRGRTLAIPPAHLAKHQAWQAEDGSYSLGLTLADEPLETARSFTAGLDGRKAVLALNDEVQVTLSPDAFEENPLVLDLALEATEARALLLALAGKPLDAPLVFVERSTRELQSVTR